MRSLTLLAALLLLVFQVRAQTLQETADQVPAQDQPGEEDQDLLGDEDQDVAVSFTGEERFSRQLTGLGTRQKTEMINPNIFTKIIASIGTTILLRKCHCRQQDQCPHTKVNKVLRHVSWACRPFGRGYELCCK
ncbi:alpha-defensin 1-like [Phyllostomus hastatus]|uniref:alpha-defensin 1-like n=1 Tax=Phyllostomus hastatus TaxID=9423 RepID=UPI001E683733|nr:alpha-defensin 1-like [Phyllostomus hastatus]